MKIAKYIQLNRNSIFNIVTLVLIACLGYFNYSLEQELKKTKSAVYPMMIEIVDLSMMMESFVDMAPEEMRRIAVEAIKEEAGK